MSFSTHIFSTTASIASIEKDINKLVGVKSVQALLGDNTDTKLVVSDDVSYGILTDNNKNQYQVNAVFNEIVLPATYITACDTYDATDTLLYSYTFTTGYGNYGYGSTSDISIEIEEPNWQIVPEKSSWQDKIAIAKTEIGSVLKNYLKTDFSTNGRYNYDYYYRYAISQSVDLLDIIDNLEIFNICSDYLVLSMCYQDLSTGGYTSQYSEKAEAYKRIYQEKLAENLKLINIDINDDGNTDIEYYDKTNRIIV